MTIDLALSVFPTAINDADRPAFQVVMVEPDIGAAFAAAAEVARGHELRVNDRVSYVVNVREVVIRPQPDGSWLASVAGNRDAFWYGPAR